MPAVNPSSFAQRESTPGREDDFRVLVTGYGQFGSYKENPSWLAVQRLHNHVLPPPSQTHTESQNPSSPSPSRRGIHITALHVPVTYAGVLSIVPGLHARPPTLPSCTSENPKGTEPDTIPPPEDGYDFILHVGVAPPDLMRLESRGHKSGYRQPDADGEYADVVELGSGDGEMGREESVEERAEAERLKGYVKKGGGGDKLRGFGKGYEEFDDEIVSDLGAGEMVDILKSRGHKDIRLSDNAGRYLCDYIYYYSLAEQHRTNSGENSKEGKGKKTRVLFLHCPPVDEPLSTATVVEYIKLVVSLACERIEKGC